MNNEVTRPFASAAVGVMSRSPKSQSDTSCEEHGGDVTNPNCHLVGIKVFYFDMVENLQAGSLAKSLECGGVARYK